MEKVYLAGLPTDFGHIYRGNQGPYVPGPAEEDVPRMHIAMQENPVVQKAQRLAHGDRDAPRPFES